MQVCFADSVSRLCVQENDGEWKLSRNLSSWTHTHTHTVDIPTKTFPQSLHTHTHTHTQTSLHCLRIPWKFERSFASNNVSTLQAGMQSWNIAAECFNSFAGWTQNFEFSSLSWNWPARVWWSVLIDRQASHLSLKENPLLSPRDSRPPSHPHPPSPRPLRPTDRH